jgi:tetratricopeptide (TPR) repeat protein
VGYWIVRGQPKEGRLWVEQYLDRYRQQEIISNEVLRELLRWAAVLAYFQANMAAMRQHADELNLLGDVQHDPVSKAYALFFMGQDALYDQDFTRAQTLFQEVLTLSRQEGLKEHAASTLLMLGLAAAGNKDYERALAFNDESLVMVRQAQGQWAESLLLCNIAVIREEQDDYPQARTLIRQSLQLSNELGDKRIVSQAFEQLAGLMSLEGEHERAVRLMGAAQALRDSIFAEVEPLEYPRRDALIGRLRANLDETMFSIAWAEGRLMTMEQAMDYAIS